MKRPAWAASPNFSPAYSLLERHFAEARRIAAGEEHPGYLYDDQQSMESAPAIYAGLMENMGLARVLTVPRDQVEALPANDGDVEPPLPFDPIFLDLDSARLGRGASAFPDARVAGCLIIGGRSIPTLPDHAPVVFVPFVQVRVGGQPQMVSLISGQGSTLSSHPIRSIRNAARHRFMQRGVNPSEQEVTALVDDIEAVGFEACNVAVDVLEMLLSANVDIAEVPMKSSRRKRELGKGREISLTVEVRQGKRKLSQPGTGEANYSHRFETRGHFKHHWEHKVDGSLNRFHERVAAASPEKVRLVNGKPCVRVFVPPFVKGDPSLPFVPKVRRRRF